jgi:hypothetical protein
VKSFRGKLTFSNVVACLALFIALGGAGYAATQLPKNSVGAAQLKKHSVTQSKLASALLEALKGAHGPVGPMGPTGPAGAAGAAGRDGSNGQNLTAETPLAPGATETGIFIAAGGGTGVTNGVIAGSAAFVQPLPAALDEEHVVRVKAGKSSAPHCPGAGHADPGYFCVYATEEENAERFKAAEDPASGYGGANRDGAQFYFKVPASGSGTAYGTWAVTAP